MRVLVTGGTGFIGRRLVARLAARGDEVVVLSQAPSGRVEEPAGRADPRLEPRVGPPTPDAFGAIDAVVNLEGESIAAGRWTQAKKERIRHSRVMGTRHLVQGIAAASRGRASWSAARRSAGTAPAATRASTRDPRRDRASFPTCAANGRRRRTARASTACAS
jgi:NAD dependent epimerase/dehydratase family enzyme